MSDFLTWWRSAPRGWRWILAVPVVVLAVGPFLLLALFDRLFRAKDREALEARLTEEATRGAIKERYAATTPPGVQEVKERRQEAQERAPGDVEGRVKELARDDTKLLEAMDRVGRGEDL